LPHVLLQFFSLETVLQAHDTSYELGRGQRLPLASDILYFASQSYFVRGSHPFERLLQSSPLRRPIQMSELIPPQALGVQNGRTSRTLAAFFGPRVFPGRDAYIALYGCTVLLAVVVGVLGLLGASWQRQVLESWVNIHALFGFLLCVLVLASCQWRIKHSPRMLSSDLRELSRHLSRIVYLLLYVIIGVKEMIVILNSIWHGDAIDFNLFGEDFRRGPDYHGFNPKDDFQLFFASGLVALIFVRVLAFRLWLRFGRTPG
jgi:cytochrome b561